LLDGSIVVRYIVRMATNTAIALPSGVDDCHALIIELHATLEEKQRRENQLAQQVEALLRRLYGPRSERIDPAQLVLFGEQAQAEPQPESEIEEPAPAPAKKRGHGRRPLPQDLPRKRIVHDVSEADKTCPECHAAKKKIGEEVSEQLEYVPASLYILEHVRPKYACPHCAEQVCQAPAAPRVIGKGLPGPGLIAHVITSKYCDHLPLYRQERILARHGAQLSRQTLCGWVLKAAGLLEPLVETMRRDVLASRVIHTDDTPVRVQGDGGNGAFTGRLWVYAGDAAHPYTVYDYTPSRKRDGPAKFLDGYEGYLQADAFGGYDGIYASGDIIECACWAHARRKFYDARSTDPNRAHRMLAWIRQLYDIEREGKTLAPEARGRLRQAKSRPLLGQIKTWLDAQQPGLLPKSPIGQAAAYTLSNWTALERYTSDGIIAIDNNTAEQALRAIAVGRKNWLFLGSDHGGRAAATHYSLIQSARRHGIDPYAYLRDTLLRLTTRPGLDPGALLPDRWAQTIERTSAPEPTA
jgi:transposase